MPKAIVQNSTSHVLARSFILSMIFTLSLSSTLDWNIANNRFWIFGLELGVHSYVLGALKGTVCVNVRTQ